MLNVCILNGICSFMGIPGPFVAVGDIINYLISGDLLGHHREEWSW